MSRKKHNNRKNQRDQQHQQESSNQNKISTREQDIQAYRAKKKLRERSRATNLLSIPAAFLVLMYIFITTFTPNMMALDTNATKFLSLSLVNLLAFIYFLTNKETRLNPGYFGTFFTTKAGLAYGGLLVITLVAFTQSINILESILHFSKFFSVFAATFMLSMLITRDLRFIRIISIVVTGILLFDSISVFYYIGEFINGNIAHITDIKSVYSNKNILASALFVKIPFALWLFVFEKAWLKRMGWIGMMMGITATFFMVARAFYVGLIIITVLFITYSTINYLREKEKHHLRVLGGYIAALALALTIFSLTQTYLYPQRGGGRHAAGVAGQIASISADDGSTRIRLNAWQWSLTMIKEQPMLGVGPGNWKLRVLEYENQTKPNFIYSYKAHNDFLEIPAERGIFAGLLYIGIYLFVGWAFLMAYFHRRQSEILYRYLFLAASGLIFYSFDAMFNFPHDRPEMVILYALYLAIGISGSYYLNRASVSGLISPSDDNETESRSVRSEAILAGANVSTGTQDLPAVKPWMVQVSAVVVFCLMAASSWVLYQNYHSSKVQRVAYQEIMRGSLTEPADRFLTDFPPIPDISAWGESIQTLKARYLIQEKRYEEALEVLRYDTTNPFDSRREYFMAICFQELNMPDSALHYTQLAYQIKPMYFRNVHLMTSLLERKDREDEVLEILENYLDRDRRTANAWIITTNIYNRRGDIDKAYELIDKALEILPRDSLIQRQHRFLTFRKLVQPHRHLYNEALPYYQNGDYSRALPLLNEYLERVPFEENVWRMRAISHYHLRQYRQCIDNIDRIFEEGESEDASLLNLRGACFQGLGDLESACMDFEASMQAGNESGTTNFNRFCANRQQ
jgi:putative inorganic carbon (hco3(-)) transporter